MTRRGGNEWLIVAVLFVGYCSIVGLLMWWGSTP